jgi:hypothetical protein
VMKAPSIALRYVFFKQQKKADTALVSALVYNTVNQVIFS